jgi:hypothetical protein
MSLQLQVMGLLWCCGLACSRMYFMHSTSTPCGVLGSPGIVCVERSSVRISVLYLDQGPEYVASIPLRSQARQCDMRIRRRSL